MVQIAYASPAPMVATTTPETLRQKAERIAVAHDIATSTLFNLITSESNWDPNKINDGGDIGIAQINPKYWPVTKEEALDPEYAMNFAAEQIKENDGVHFTSCNCVSFARAMHVHFPRLQDAKDLDTNSTVPIKGGLIKMVYSGVYHLVYIESVQDDGIHIREANFSPCKIGKRIIDFNDPHIVGYYRDPTTETK